MEGQAKSVETDFIRYKSAVTDSEKQTFWDALDSELDQLTNDERSAKQQTVRNKIDQILERLTQIQQQLSVEYQPV